LIFSVALKALYIIGSHVKCGYFVLSFGGDYTEYWEGQELASKGHLQILFL